MFTHEERAQFGGENCPLKMTLKTLCAIFIAEALVMAVLYFMPEITSPMLEALLDALLLSLMISPLVFLFVYRPMMNSLVQRQRAADELKLHRDHLDEIVFERTHELTELNAQLLQEVAERKLAERALRESEEKFRRIADDAFEVIYTFDLNGIATYVSPSIERVLGLDPNEVLGTSSLQWAGIGGRRSLYKILKQVAAGNVVQGAVYRMKRKDGTTAVLEVNASPMYCDGELVGGHAMVHDVTETKRLRELKSRAERLDTAGQIAGQVAHDFNNLLGPLMAYPEFIRDELPEDHPALEYLENIERSARQISEINQQLLSLGRRGHYNQDTLNLNSIIRETVAEVSSSLHEIEIVTELSEELMPIQGGGAQLHRVFLNLILNARDALGDSGRITVRSENYYVDAETITFGRVPAGEYVKVTVEDNGPGISAEDLSRIFDPFFTTKKSDKKRGSGLGLSVVDSVVKDHRGHLDVSAPAGEGASFFLYFPVCRSSFDETESNEVLVGGVESILVVDDDATQREVSSRLLTKLGYRVTLAASGELACEMIGEAKYDLVILDMLMPPGIDGAETYRRICEITPNQRAIILSGFSESERVREAMNLGVSAFVKKPLSREVIARAVRAAFAAPVPVSAG